MGTNYYLSQADGSRVHIGKSSAGWAFGLHVLLEGDIRVESLSDWQRLWSLPGAVITDEYGETLSPAEMLAVVTERRRAEPINARAWGFIDYRYQSLAEFLDANQADYDTENNVLRHRVGRHCIAQGPGTYDLIQGDFS